MDDFDPALGESKVHAEAEGEVQRTEDRTNGKRTNTEEVSSSRILKDATSYNEIAEIRSDIAELKAMIKNADFPHLHGSLSTHTRQMSDFLGMYVESKARKKAKHLSILMEPHQRSATSFHNLSQIAAFLFLESEPDGKVLAMLASDGDRSLSDGDLLAKCLIETLYPVIFKHDNIKNVVTKLLNQLSSQILECDSSVEDSVLHIHRGLSYLKQNNKTWGDVFSCLIEARSSPLLKAVKTEIEDIWFSLDDLFEEIKYLKVHEEVEIVKIMRTIPLESSAAFMCFIYLSAKVLRTRMEIDMQGYARIEGSSGFSVKFAQCKYECTQKVVTKAKAQARVTAKVYKEMVKIMLPQLRFHYHAYIFCWMLKQQPSLCHADEDGIMTLISSSEE